MPRVIKTERVSRAVLFGFALLFCAFDNGRFAGAQTKATAVSGTDGVLPKLKVTALCSTSLIRGMDRSEFVNAGNLRLQTIGKDVGFSLDSTIELADTVAEMRRRTDDKSADVFVTSALEYLAIDRPSLAPVAALVAGNDQTGKIRYLVLTNTDSGITRLDDLKGKIVTSYSRSDPNLPRLWLEVALHDKHLPAADVFFRSIASATKPSAACLPTFFGKADACVIDNSSWDVLRELNPQLGSRLKVVGESPELVETVMSLHANRKDHRSDILNAILNLQNDPGGKQVLLFFKCGRTVGIGRSDLGSVAELRSSYLKFTAPADRKITNLTGGAIGAEGAKNQ